MKDFKYYAPEYLEEALTLKNKYKDKARLLAGGTDLIVQMKNGRAGSRRFLIDTKKIPELNRLELKNSNDLFIGAAVSLSKVREFKIY